MYENEIATRDSWKTAPLPDNRQRVDFQRTFSLEEFEKIRRGHIPQEMEDKWFIFFESGWLYFHRSWTGYCIYQLKLEQRGLSQVVEEAWVNRDESQYTSKDVTYDLDLLNKVFKWCLGV